MWKNQQGLIVTEGDVYTAPDGTQYPAAFPRGEIPGLTQHPDPDPLPPTLDELRRQAKVDREVAVAAIKVTTAAGNTFDGDEVSQGRMDRAITVLSSGLAPSVPWVLADNTVIQATYAELTEALFLAGKAQTELWVLPS